MPASLGVRRTSKVGRALLVPLDVGCASELGVTGCLSVCGVADVQPTRRNSPNNPKNRLGANSPLITAGVFKAKRDIFPSESPDMVGL